MEKITSTWYAIAGSYLEIQCSTEFDLGRLLPSFADFKLGDDAVVKGHPITQVIVTKQAFGRSSKDAKLLSDISIVWGNRFKFFELPDVFVTTVAGTSKQETWFMESEKDFSKSTIYWIDDKEISGELLSWMIMVTFAQSAVFHNTILVHASVIERDGKGYAFLGKSGTGKSTHSRMWQASIHGAELLNDDNPAVKIESDGSVKIYGTPWSGKTPCYRNMVVDLQALVRLKQAPINQMEWKSGQQAFLTLLPSCSAIRWNQEIFANMADIVQNISTEIPVGELSCLPNGEAAKLCLSEIENIK
ncbi:hypothetical protein ACFSQ3_05025 [Sphingobacterium corticis]|uniref:Phosphoenolpyruvate carboxykinase n=1 Tax=Sphingobacterium corticis TaxID=1812823 RepID=A0ABW5NJA7_9SPHI